MADPQLARSVDEVVAEGLRQSAMRDVVNVGLAGLGVGMAGRSAVGLYNLLKGRPKPPATTNGPAEVPLPIPVAKTAWDATTKAGLPWYYPATILGGVGAAYGGWKAIDSVLDSRAKQDREEELNRTRTEFHDALLKQYDAPVKLAADAPIGPSLDALFEKVEATYEKFTAHEKAANLQDLAGQGLGIYATMAIPAALWSGAAAYDYAKKNSNRAVLESALQRRDRRKFMQQPPEIYAVPEPVEVPGAPAD